MVRKATKVRVADVLREATGLPVKTSRELAQAMIDEFDLFEREDSVAPPLRPIRAGEIWHHIEKNLDLLVIDAIPKPVKISEAVTVWEEATILWEMLPAATAVAANLAGSGSASAPSWRDQCVFVAESTAAWHRLQQNSTSVDPTPESEMFA